MKFGSVPVAEAIGTVSAHNVQPGGLRKGEAVSADHVAALHRAGIAAIVVAALEPGDLGEDEAARRLAEALTGEGLRIERPFTGRANIFAGSAGVLVLDVATIDRINAVDERLTLATLPAFRAVEAGEMVGTVKVIPFAVEAAVVEAAKAAAGSGALRLARFRPYRVAVVSTVVPSLKPSVIAKTLRILDDRLRPAGSTTATTVEVPHEAGALAAAIERLAPGHDLVVIYGASAIADRRDVIPAALERAGGTVEHLGMPVDPGNLLMLGRFGTTPVLGAPGCARSPKENGFDWVLQRLLAGLAVTPVDIRRLGAGGLLVEIVSRPQPSAGRCGVRARQGRARKCRAGRCGVSRIAALILAAGTASRYRAADPSVPTKLVVPYDGVPLVRRAAGAALASRARPIVVVTGHAEAAVRAALDGLDVTFVHNTGFATGLASSLRAGLAALPEDASGALVLLGDMPAVTGDLLDRLIAACEANPAIEAVVPVHAGRRGNPALLGRALFGRAQVLSGDEGARRLLVEARVDEVEAGEAASLDVDEPVAILASPLETEKGR